MDFHYRKFNFPDPRKEKPESTVWRLTRRIGKFFVNVTGFFVLLNASWISTVVGLFAIAWSIIVMVWAFKFLADTLPTAVNLPISFITGLVAAAVPIYLSGKLGEDER